MRDDVEARASGPGHTDEGASQPSLSLLLKRAEHAVRTGLGPLLAAAGLSFEEWRILSVLADQPGLTMMEIGAAAVVPRASMTRYMDKLVERALVVRRIDAEDKRRAVSALSGLGRDLTQQIRAEERRIEGSLTNDASLTQCRDRLSHGSVLDEA